MAETEISCSCDDESQCVHSLTNIILTTNDSGSVNVLHEKRCTPICLKAPSPNVASFVLVL